MKIMNKKLPGFMGKTHTALSILGMAICMMIPAYPFQITFGVLKSNIPLFIVCLAVLVGGALLPDLDNDQSTAGATLGPLGSMFTLFMKSTSSVVWNVYHFKGDHRPPTQHRYLWHTPIIGIGLIALFYFGLPNGNYTILTNIQNSISTKQFGTFIQNNAILVLFIILCFMAVLVGSNSIIYTISKIFPIPGLVKYVLPVGSLIYIGVANYSDLRILGVCLGAGYLMHCLEDFFCDSSIPLIWPIPAFWKRKVWWKPHLPLTVTTGSTINTIIDLIGIILAVIMLIVAFMA